MSAVAALPTPEEYDDRLPVQATAYIAKMRRAHRPPTLIAAFVGLMLVTLRQVRQGAITIALRAQISILARAISVYVGRRMGIPAPDPHGIALQLTQRVEAYLNRAWQTLDPDQMRARAVVIVIAETQNATAMAMRQASTEVATIVRRTTTTFPCVRCEQLAGTYHRPFPEEMWDTHPNCCCEWTAIIL